MRRPTARHAASKITGWTPDGKVFDSSVLLGEPATLPLDGVIAGWTEGLQPMVKREKRHALAEALSAFERYLHTKDNTLPPPANRIDQREPFIPNRVSRPLPIAIAQLRI